LAKKHGNTTHVLVKQVEESAYHGAKFSTTLGNGWIVSELAILLIMGDLMISFTVCRLTWSQAKASSISKYILIEQTLVHVTYIPRGTHAQNLLHNIDFQS
jgi:hypothetical protein